MSRFFKWLFGMGSNSFNTYPISLTTAQTKMRVGLPPSKFLAVDNSSTGQATAYFDSVSAGGVSLTPGWTGAPNFKELFLDFSAQPGKKLLLVYGDDPAILDAGKTSRIDAPLPGSFYSNSLTNTVSTLTIVSAANNANGIKIKGGSLYSLASSGGGAAGQFASSKLSCTSGVLDTIATYGPAGINISDEKTYPIQEFYVPRNEDLTWNSNFIGAGLSINGIILNYEIL